MMKFRNHAAILALAGLALSQAAEARSKKRASECITAAEVNGLIRYAMPSVIEGVMEKCATQLPSGGFLATSGDAMVARYSEGRDEVWPTARAAFMKLAKDSESTEIMDAVNDSLLQGLAAEAISGLMLEEVKPEKCGGAERLLEATNNIAPQDFSAFVAALLALVAGPKDKEMPICDS